MAKDRMMALAYGWGTILVLMVVSSFALALFLKFSNMTESTLQWATLIIGLITLFIGGFISGAKGKEQGWLLGLLTGIGFLVFVLLFQFLGYQKGVSTSQLLYQGGYVVMALFGGMMGVNVGGKSK
ncbi:MULTISPECIES: TIGR04086 family membrane protein [Pontibacillus]|uniref:TIGR04086 family membrane protein n=1 Tax=Pontibacillus chungwhensis TaxID=265426 RepID=A0ABY8UX46_9BACI|nr:MULTISPECIES: TIGR04086 family membrane protein [Pontibacillus]MCD5323699.1 TIGR04086 family membrane protein [Pontibacillus sp. HN14]WIF97064.1 TIGR04086 family membrane protein [Pontibacillus chungwhensis]